MLPSAELHASTKILPCNPLLILPFKKAPDTSTSCVFLCEWVHMCLHIPVEVRRRPLVLVLRFCPPWSLRKGLTGLVWFALLWDRVSLCRKEWPWTHRDCLPLAPEGWDWRCVLSCLLFFFPDDIWLFQCHLWFHILSTVKKSSRKILMASWFSWRSCFSFLLRPVPQHTGWCYPHSAWWFVFLLKPSGNTYTDMLRGIPPRTFQIQESWQSKWTTSWLK